MMKRIYEDFLCVVKDQRGRCDWLDVNCGVKQGCKMFGFLFLITMDDMDYAPEGRRRRRRPRITWRYTVAKERNEVGWKLWMEVRRAAADREEWSRSEEALCEDFPNRRNVLKHSPDFVLRKKIYQGTVKFYLVTRGFISSFCRI